MNTLTIKNIIVGCEVSATVNRHQLFPNNVPNKLIQFNILC